MLADKFPAVIVQKKYYGVNKSLFLARSKPKELNLQPNNLSFYEF